ncbi:MAG: hypothetical protein ACMVY4_16705 [Minwuia sp.]
MGKGNFSDSLSELQNRKKALEVQLEQAGSEARIHVHPNVAELYRRKVT